MGYAFYKIAGMNRGYGVRCKCHKRGCSKKIDRGLAYLCYCCTWYFCDKHLTVPFDSNDESIKVECFAGEDSQVCLKCCEQLEETSI